MECDHSHCDLVRTWSRLIIIACLTMADHHGSNTVCSVLEIDVGIMCACMPLFAPLFAKDGRFSKWTTYILSMRSRLLSTRTASRHTTDPESQKPGENQSYTDLVPKPGAYLELNERKASGSVHEDKPHSRKEWFDKTTTVNSTVHDRDSRDMAGYAV